MRDGAAWERLCRRIQSGDLQDWMRELDTFRHDVRGKVLVTLPWSPMSDLDLAAVPVEDAEHDPSVYMEDTMWPFEDTFLDYIDASGSIYAASPSSTATPAPVCCFLQIEAGFQPAFGSHTKREVILMQRILDPDRLLGLLTTDIPAEMRAPGTWMHDALALRDRWESRLLRTATLVAVPAAGGGGLMLFVHEVHEVDGREGRRVRGGVPRRLDAVAREGRRRPPALVREPRARQRACRTTS